MKLTTRGERLFKTLLIAGAVLLGWAVFQIVGNLWWTGSGYCWGSMVECMAGGL